MKIFFHSILIFMYLSYFQFISIDPFVNPYKSFQINLSKSSPEIAETTKKTKADSLLLLKISSEILRAIKKREYAKLVTFFHPKHGVRFSPYASINTKSDRLLSSSSFIKFAKQNKHINWHSSFEGTEFLTVDQYLKKHVYDADFITAPVKSTNKFHSHGTDLNNISEIYTKCDVVEFYFPGFKKEYEGMDFKGLRLVFKWYNKRPYLIAIVHDEWTP